MSEDLIFNHEEWVQRYRQHFELNISEICQISPRVLKKILFVVMLESLAKARHPQLGNPRERFLCLLDSSSNWDDLNRVSLPQLVLRLDKEEQYKSSPLAQRIRGEIQGWQWGSVYPMRGRDPSAEEVKKWNEVRELGEPIAKLVDQVKHCNLFYDYRNHLVHEFREPGGSGMEAMDHDYPYYFSLNSDGERIWDLIYPVGFFHRLVMAVLENACTYFVEQRIDPYEAYDWGPTWRPR
jgi:hypothetical protein